MKAIRHNRSESDVQRAVLEYLKLKRIFAFRVNNTGLYDPARKRFRSFQGMRGVSDILGVLNDGRFLAVEVKRPGGKMSNEQKAFLEQVNERGGVGLCVDGIEKLEAFC